MAIVASDRSSRSGRRIPARRRPACAILGLICFNSGLFCLTSSALAQPATSGWSTTVEPAPRQIAPLPPGGYNTELPDALRREGVSLRLETDLGGRPQNQTSRFLILRRGLAKDAEGGPYVGAGFGLEDNFGVEDEELTGKLVGGVAAPLAEGVKVYGEYQHQRSFEHGDGDDRFQLGLRREF